VPAKTRLRTPTAAQNGQTSPAVTDRPCIDCLEEPPVHKTGARARPGAFWLLAYLFAAVMLGTTLLSRCMWCTRQNDTSPRAS
jgi:hypothetical protein